MSFSASATFNGIRRAAEQVPLAGCHPQCDANPVGGCLVVFRHRDTSALSPSQAITTWARTSTFSARLMAAKIADALVMVGLPDFDSIR
jgi:hypothetical protein